MICEGYSKEKAEEFSRMHLKLIRSSSHQEFLETIKYFENNPINLCSINGYDEDFAQGIYQWWPLDWVKTQSFNPMGIIAQTKIPVLSLYGAKDTQVDPHQGAENYRKSLKAAGNPFYDVRIIPDADHNMALSETGCLKEQKARKKSQIASGLTDLLADWLKKLKKYLDNLNRQVPR
jgi:pimeloyl-ACP methyl ester carboxylesterase